MDIKLLKKESYLQMIKNSVGTKMFRSLYLEIDGKRIDATKKGGLSCAYFVSSVLLIHGLIKEIHATVQKTVIDIEKSNWKKTNIKKIKPGDAIVWEQAPGEYNKMYFHIGFYIGNKKAISNSWQKQSPAIHSWDYNGKRKIIAVYKCPI